MYMPPVMDPKKSVMENQVLLEEKMAKDLDVTKDAKILEIGCGCGAIARSMAEITGANLYGFNIDKSQIEKAWRDPELQKSNFTVGDFNKPFNFSDNTFGAVENIKKEVALYGRFETIFSFLTSLRILPRKIFLLVRRMHANSESYIKAEELGLISLNWYAIMTKPK